MKSRNHSLPGLFALFLMVAVAWPAAAQIASTSGDVVPVTRAAILAAGSVDEDDYASDTEIRVFVERQGLELVSDMVLDVTADGTYDVPLSPGGLAAGEAVTSVMIHADRASLGGLSTLVGTIEFSADILGVVLEDGTLDAWDSVIGLGGLVYPTGLTYRGLEVDDAAWANPDEITLSGRTLELDLRTSSYTDQLRVILAGTGRAVSFSIDCQGPSRGITPSWGAGNMYEGDVLTPGAGGPSGPNPAVPGPTVAPGVMLKAADLGINSYGWNGVQELDALSFGRDRGNRLRFSVDEFAVGVSGYPAPDVYSEGALPGNNEEASADVFAYLGPALPAWPGFAPGNREVLDGDGVAPTGRPGFGLIEPNVPTVSALPDSGDNLDALDLGTRTGDLDGRVYFSLDASFADWAETGVAPPNYGTALAHGVDPADVLMSWIGSGTYSVYASAASLGLGCNGECEDDIDALILWDDGDGEYEPGTDRILFSLRRGSGTLGQLDGRLGLPITEADILRPGPEIVIPGESLGLDTSRGGIISPYQVPDDVDGLDRVFSRSAPVGNDDAMMVPPGGQVQVNLLDNDFPLDGHLVPVSVVIFDPPEFGTIVSVDPESGAVLYQHGGGSATSDQFSYIVYDDRGECTEPTTVHLTVGVVSVDDPAHGRKTQFAFAGPNPFSARTAFRLEPARSGHATVTVYDLAGRKVRTLLDEHLEAGQIRQLAWDGRTDGGRATAAGMYLVRMRTEDGEQRLRVVRMK